MKSIRSRSNHVLPTSSDPNGKLMSISSIIATPPMYTASPSSSSTTKMYHQEAMERRASAPTSSHHPYNNYYYQPPKYDFPSNTSTFFRSPPTSPNDEKLFESSAGSSPTLSISSYHTKTKKYNLEEDDDMAHLPLTLQERRLRNKAASAKYRQKKNQQQNDMRVMIGRLSEQNAVLERQLQELRLENDRLKTTADKLRGKLVAKKMLKKWIGKHHYSTPDSALLAAMSDDEDDDDLESIEP